MKFQIICSWIQTKFQIIHVRAAIMINQIALQLGYQLIQQPIYQLCLLKLTETKDATLQLLIATLIASRQKLLLMLMYLADHQKHVINEKGLLMQTDSNAIEAMCSTVQDLD